MYEQTWIATLTDDCVVVKTSPKYRDTTYQYEFRRVEDSILPTPEYTRHVLSYLDEQGLMIPDRQFGAGQTVLTDFQNGDSHITFAR